jgi:hypothetical protein
VEVAAWDVPARLNLFDGNHQVTGGSTRVLEPDEPGEGSVEALPLDDVLLDEEHPELNRVDLVKLDVEGADLHALWGMRRILEQCRPVLFIEDHSIYGYYAHADLEELLAKLGYEAETMIAQLAGDRSAPYVIARPQPAEAAE